MGRSSTALAFDAVAAAAVGDLAAATSHLERATRKVRTQARRDRQFVEIAAALVAGDDERASGLAAEHRQEFPHDDELLDALLTAGPASATRC